MALLRGSEHYTMFTFTEDHDVINRRLHRVTLQDKTGKVHILEGKELPHKLTVDTSKALKGRHISEILTKPGDTLPSLGSEQWPSKRDMLHGFAAFVLFMSIQHFVRLASEELESTSVIPSSFALPPFLPGSGKESAVLSVRKSRGKSRESFVAFGDEGLLTRVPSRRPFTDGGDYEPTEIGSDGAAQTGSKPRS